MVKIGIVGGRLYEMVRLHPYRKWMDLLDNDDIEKLEKFLSSKPVAEKEKGLALLEDVASYAETSSNRRKILLNYFGESFDELNGDGCKMDDNSINPKEKIEVKDQVLIIINEIL